MSISWFGSGANNNQLDPLRAKDAQHVPAVLSRYEVRNVIRQVS
jgi:hypothetical protein